MSDNKKIINEFFFKKETFADKLKRKFPQYEPQDVRDDGQPKGFGGILAPTDRGLAVTDPQEAGKRVVSALGASIGVNSVRNIASRSIKSFPIIISENVDPETSVMLKRVLEEQYAEYISLLISNQVVDISAYKTGEKEGNIAIQALSSVSSEDEAKMLARKVASGEVEPEDFLRNLTAYNLVRNENKEYSTGNETMDKLLEGAVIVPASESKSLVEFMATHSDEITNLLEAEPSEREEDDKKSEKSKKFYDPNKDKVSLRDFMVDELKMSNEEAEKKMNLINTLRGYNPAADNQEKGPYSRLSSPDVLLNINDIRPSIDKSLGEILLSPKNAAIRDRFEKATFLLQSNRIAGTEWVEYLVKRLGIPVSRQVRRSAITLYRLDQIVDPDNNNRRISRRDIRRIAENRRTTERTLMDVLSTDGRTFLTFVLGTLGVGGAVATSNFLATGGTIAAGGGIAGAVSSITGFTSTLAASLGITGALGTSLLLGAVVGVPIAAVAAVITAALQFRQRRIQKTSKIEGWERVEALILAMEEQQSSVRKLSVVDEIPEERSENIKKAMQYADDNVVASSAEINKAMDDYKGYIETLMKKAAPRKQALSEFFIPETSLNDQEKAMILEETRSAFKAAFEGNKEHDSLSLSEAIISTDTPVELVATQTYEYDPKKAPEVLVVPKFTTRSQYAYGSVEYEKKDLKDRKYNAPLLLTIKFKERYDDGKFSDNELVAVIGILGVITRVPSDEMEYILSSNAENKTLKGILEPDGDPAQLISNIIGIEKISKDVNNLPISKDVWQNLERVSRLAVANSLAGRKNDNIANAHIAFAQKEIDNIRADMNVDYMKDIKLVKSLLKRYSAFTIMIANDVSEKIYIFDNPSNINWDVVPYSSFRNKDSGDQLNAMLNKMSSGRL